MSDIPKHADTVIVGGGIVGCSVAYHLGELGAQGVVLLERDQLSCGTTWHAAGLVGQLRATVNLTRLAQYTTTLYQSLEKKTGQATGFRQHGSLAIAHNQARMTELLRGASMARSFGLDVEEVGVQDIKSKWPLLHEDGLYGGVFLPADGQTNPIDTTLALAKGARNYGVDIREKTPVLDLKVANGRICEVITNQGSIRCNRIVISCGMWSRHIGHTIGVSIPLQACEHFYIVTEAIEGLPHDLPVLREPDACLYYKEDAGKLLVGMFEPVAKPWAVDGIPEDFSFAQLPEDYDQIAPYVEKAAHRVPILQNVGIRTLFNGPESFTPDDRYLLGKAPELEGVYLACGFNSIGIQSAGGAGKVLAEWIVNQRPPMDLWDVDARRVFAFQSNKRYLKDRVRETLGLLYAMHWPFRQYQSARGVRQSALHQRLQSHNACFGETAGWERPNWYANQAGIKPEYEYSYGRQNWFHCSAHEHLQVRENAGLFDLSSFAKFWVTGRNANAVLNRLSCNHIPAQSGSVTYTQWLNDQGGIEADLTITTMGPERYLVVTAAATQVRDGDWLSQAARAASECEVFDATSAYAVIAVMGPKAVSLLQPLCEASLDIKDFRYGSAQEIALGYARVWAMRISYVGESGFELYIPTEYVQHVYDEIVSHGQPLGLVHAGYHALNSLRIEKAYRHWGHDITDEDNPLQAGLGFAVSWRKEGGFRGLEALQKLKQTPLNRRLVQFALHDPEPVLFHDEPIWCNGRMCGLTTSAMYGHSLGSSIALGYIQSDEAVTQSWLDDAELEIELAGVRHRARGSLKPLYDPQGTKMKAN